MQTGYSAMADTQGLTFNKHTLSINIYSVSDVNIVYAGSPHRLSAGKLMRAKTAADEKRFPGFGSGTYITFAGPVDIAWKSQDGTDHSYALDLDEVFKDRKVLHTEDEARFYKPEPVYGSAPTIIIELNDRTLNVYMFVTIRLEKDEMTREHKDHYTLAYTKQF